MGVRDAVIADEVVHQYDKLLMGGIWAIVDLEYDPEFQIGGATRPSSSMRLKPIQQPTTDLDEYVRGRAAFTTGRVAGRPAALASAWSRPIPISPSARSCSSWCA